MGLDPHLLGSLHLSEYARSFDVWRGGILVEPDQGHLDHRVLRSRNCDTYLVGRGQRIQNAVQVVCGIDPLDLALLVDPYVTWTGYVPGAIFRSRCSMGMLSSTNKQYGADFSQCWVSREYQNERLWLHYLWIFIVEFGTIIIYAHVFFHLRGRIRSIIANDTSKLTRATKFMVMYPFVYVVLTLPIAVGRMVAMTGTEPPDLFFVVAGCLLTSCGWIDALLYTLTRRVLVSGDLSTGHYNRTATATNPNAARQVDYDLHSMNAKEPTSTSRTITITGGRKKLSHIVEHRGTRSYAMRSQNEDMDYDEDSYTRTGSQDSIIKPVPTGHAINIVTETSVQVEPADDRLGGSPMPKEWLDTNVQPLR